MPSHMLYTHNTHRPMSQGKKSEGKHDHEKAAARVHPLEARVKQFIQMATPNFLVKFELVQDLAAFVQISEARAFNFRSTPFSFSNLRGGLLGAKA